MSVSFSSVNLFTDKTKVLLYNFFKDSTASLNQWRLLLNGVSDGHDLRSAPTFDETRHASICVEVRYIWFRPPVTNPRTLFGLAVEILVRCNYSGSEQPLDRGQFRIS